MRACLLLIDDEEIQHFIFGNMVKKLDVETDFNCCNSAETALEYLAKCTIYSFPQIIFIDLIMGVMSGFEFVEYYEKKNYQSQYPQTKLFILTSSVLPQDKKIAEPFSSISGFLIKPLLLKDLEMIVQQINKQP
jgi:CheY-like chemotaxis protein